MSAPACGASVHQNRIYFCFVLGHQETVFYAHNKKCPKPYSGSKSAILLGLIAVSLKQRPNESEWALFCMGAMLYRSAMAQEQLTFSSCIARHLQLVARRYVSL